MSCVVVFLGLLLHVWFAGFVVLGLACSPCSQQEGNQDCRNVILVLCHMTLKLMRSLWLVRPQKSFSDFNEIWCVDRGQ